MASSLEGNKIAAAVLTAGIIAMAAGVFSGILYAPNELEEPVIAIAMVEDAGDGEPQASDVQPLPVLLAAATVEDGEGVAKKCTACHAFEAGGANKVGPALYGVVGRDIASGPDYAYDDALLSKEGSWTFDSLDAFLAAPKEWAPGTKMAFAGLSKPEDRADIIVYLNAQSDSPLPLPEPEEVEPPAAAPEAEAGAATDAAVVPSDTAAGSGTETAAASEAPADAAAGSETETAAVAPADSAAPAAPVEQAAASAATGALALIAAADPAAGEKAAKKCAACHTFDEGGANRVGPNLWGVVGRGVGAHEGFKFSDALKGVGGEWSYAQLDAFLADPKGFAAGNKMAFAGIKKEEERAQLLAYLRTLSGAPVPLP